MTIIYPLFAMIFLTLIIGVQLLYCNSKAVLKGEVNIKSFRLFDSEIPDHLKSISQHYKNMFELPVLFYILCILFIVNDNFTDFDVIIAWGFFSFRFLHSLVRISNQNVNLRFGLFIGSFVMLIIGWISFILSYLRLIN